MIGPLYSYLLPFGGTCRRDNAAHVSECLDRSPLTWLLHSLVLTMPHEAAPLGVCALGACSARSLACNEMRKQSTVVALSWLLG